MAVDTELGVAGKVGTEFEEKGTEVGVHTIEVKVIDHGGGLDKPRIGSARLRIVATLGLDDGCLFLGLADKNDALVFGKGRQAVQHDIVLALSVFESNELDVVGLGERLHRVDEGFGNGSHQTGRSEQRFAVKPEESRDAAWVL